MNEFIERIEVYAPDKSGGHRTQSTGSIYTFIGMLPVFWQRKSGAVFRLRHFLKKHRQAIYTAILLSGKLNGYLVEVDQQTQEMVSQLEKQMADHEKITEYLKAIDQIPNRSSRFRNGIKLEC